MVAGAGCAPGRFDEARFLALSATLTGHGGLPAEVAVTWYDILIQTYGEARLRALAAAVEGAGDADEAARRVPADLAEVAEAVLSAWYLGEATLPNGAKAWRGDGLVAWTCVPYAHRWGIPGGDWASRPA